MTLNCSCIFFLNRNNPKINGFYYIKSWLDNSLESVFSIKNIFEKKLYV